jgi:SAM-dependent methyltransferase
MPARASQETAIAGPTLTRVADERPQQQIHIRCPRCSANLPSFNCPKCGFQLYEQSGIIHALPPMRVDYYSRFIDDYERIRAAEGRGSKGDDFYLGLPYCDVSSRNRRQWRIRARSYNYLTKRIVTPNILERSRILDLGAGNGWMSYRLALAGYRPVAVDLLTNSNDGLGAAAHYQKHLPNFFPRFQAELMRLPFQDEQFDAAIFNASFHYAEDATAALAEALRCVKSRGLVIICDTPWYSCEDSGDEMVHERRENFLRQYGTASASLKCIEFLTNERLQLLEERLGIRWTVYSPHFGMQFALRPYLAKLRHKREPARFRIYVAQKANI